jgi:predicted permease
VVSREFAEVYDRFVVCTQVSIYLYCSMLFSHVSLYSCMHLYPFVFTSYFVSVLNTGLYKYYHLLSPIFTPPVKLLGVAAQFWAAFGL